MRVSLNTNCCDIIVPDTYGSEILNDIADEYIEDFKKVLVDKGIEYINDALHQTDTFENYDVKAESGLKSPRYYNFSTDWFDFSIEVTAEIVDRMKKLEDDDEFFTWTKARFGHHSGFHSFYPFTREKYHDALKEIGDNADFALALSMVILYETDEVISNDYQHDYLDECDEYANTHGMKEYESEDEDE